MSWILILTMISYGTGGIDHIAFPSRASCMTAASAWLKEVHRSNSNVALSALCVPAEAPGDAG